MGGLGNLTLGSTCGGWRWDFVHEKTLTRGVSIILVAQQFASAIFCLTIVVEYIPDSDAIIFQP